MQNHLETHLSAIQGKISTLRFISNTLSDSQLEYWLTLKTGEKVLIDQNLIPFNLEMEFRNLIGDSIDEYQRQIQNLSFKP